MFLCNFPLSPPHHQSPDPFQQFEESNADSRMLREELEKRCEEKGQDLELENFDCNLLPLAQRPNKKSKRVVIDEKIALTDSELRSWFQDTSRYSISILKDPLFLTNLPSITRTPKFRTLEEELQEEKIKRGCAAFSLFETTLHPSLMKLYSAPPPQAEKEEYRPENQFRDGEEMDSTLDAELNAKIMVADHFGVSMDELFGGEMDFHDNSIHPLREGEDETIRYFFFSFLFFSFLFFSFLFFFTFFTFHTDPSAVTSNRSSYHNFRG